MRLDRRKRIILLSGGAALTAITILTTGSYIILNRPDEPETYQDYIRMAEKCVENGDLLSASNSYWKAVEINSSGTEAYLGLGKIYEEKSETKKARLVYEAGIKNTGDETLEQQLEQTIIAENQQETVRQEHTQKENTEQSLAQHTEQEEQSVGQSASESTKNSQNKSESQKNTSVRVSAAEELPDDREDPDTDVYGTVTSADSTPVAGADVLLIEKLDEESDELGAQYSAQTDADGYYSLPDIDNGSYWITVTADGFMEHEEAIVLRDGGEYECNMELASRDYSEDGLMSPEEPGQNPESPEEPGQNSESPEESIQDPEPSEEPIQDPEPPEEPGQDQMSDENEPETSGDEPSDDPTPETYCVSGIVREKETDDPLEDIEVALIPEGMEDPENRSEWTVVRTDETGLYSLTEISAGEYTLRIEEDGYEETETKIVVTDADVTEDIVLTISNEDDIPPEE